MAILGKLIDTSKCTGCRGCQVACKNWNELPAEIEPFKGNYQTHEDLLPNTYTIVKFLEYEENGEIQWYFRKHQCLHCLDPVCMKVCPRNAITKTPTGQVVKDKQKCVGCHYCEYACPFLIPKYNKELDRVTKCEMCYDRVAEGLEPACVQACPPGAIKFGPREELLAYAKNRVAELKASYPKARVYGETEAGGTNVLYILLDEPEKYELPKDPKEAGVTTFWQDIVQPYVPWLIGVAAATSVFSFFSTRLIGGAAKHEGGDSHE